MPNPTVCVLLPTFNGEKYLKQQLESVLNQENVKIKLLVQDDSSTDKTLEILSEYRDKLIIFHSSKNQGTTKTLIELLGRVDDEDYLAFCDQDDIWKNNHLISSIRELSKFAITEPVMNFPVYEFIDEQSQSIGIRVKRKRIGLANSLVENPAIGCGIVINRAGIDLIKQIQFDHQLFIDQQLYFLFSNLGSVNQCSDITLKYRLHGLNQVGVRNLNNSILKIRRIFIDNSLRNTRIALNRFAEVNSSRFTNLMKGIPGKHFDSLNGHFLTRFKYLLKPVFRREKWWDQVIFQALIFLGKY